MRSLPVFPDLRAFLDWTENPGQLARIPDPWSVRHEMTAVQLASLRADGPVLRFHAPVRASGARSAVPVVTNLFATRARVAAGLGQTPDEVPGFGAFLAALRSPAPVEGMRDALSRWPMLQAALSCPRVVTRAPVRQVDAVPDLSALPVQVPWPGDQGRW